VPLYQLLSISPFSFFLFFFFVIGYSPHGNIQQKPRDEFCWEVRMSMLIFFLLLRRLSLIEAPVPSPMVTVLSVKEAFLFPVLSLVQSDTEEHLCIGLLHGLGDPNIWGLYWFPVGGKTSPKWAIQAGYFSTQPIFCCDCHAVVFWWQGVVAACLTRDWHKQAL